MIGFELFNGKRATHLYLQKLYVREYRPGINTKLVWGLLCTDSFVYQFCSSLATLKIGVNFAFVSCKIYQANKTYILYYYNFSEYVCNMFICLWASGPSK